MPSRFLVTVAMPALLGPFFLFGIVVLQPPSAAAQSVTEASGSRDTAGVAQQKSEQLSPAMIQQRRERDDLRREDMAIELAQMGLPLQWQSFTLEQLTDWRDRLRAAQALSGQYGVVVDWRTQSLANLTDMRLRAAKASELSGLYGVQVDWRRYSWVALEALRRQASKLTGQPTGDESATDSSLGRPAGGGPLRHRIGFRTSDPDAILEPTFAFDTPAVWSHPLGRRAKADPDAILVPTFVSVPAPPVGPDDIIDPWSPRRSAFGP